MSFIDDKYIAGDPYVYCDICGFRYHASQTKMQWDNKRTCLKDWDERPDFFFRIPTYPNEGQPIRNPRPQAAITYRSIIGPLDYAGLDPRRPL